MAELPRGTVTFLFTDIEGSTRLLERLGPGYSEVLDTHRRILREAVEERGGRAKAWADLDVEMMRDDPPLAPFMNPAARDFVSPSLGCYVYHPLYGFDLAAACKK